MKAKVWHFSPKVRSAFTYSIHERPDLTPPFIHSGQSHTGEGRQTVVAPAQRHPQFHTSLCTHVSTYACNNSTKHSAPPQLCLPQPCLNYQLKLLYFVKKKVMTLVQEIKIPDLLKRGVSASEAGCRYHVNKSTICTIRNTEDKIPRSLCAAADVTTKLMCVHRDPVHEKEIDLMCV